ncbi:MAG: hypothetical protein GF349_01445 [Candidatus Magasanikbacteria bacterium]|nr:hypothetical protein [Candidatus Magasanikbacteria bacterium]
MTKNQNYKPTSKQISDGKLCAVLAWFFPIGLFWYLAEAKMNKNSFVSFHVKQSLVLFIALLLVNVVGGIIPILGWFLILPLGNLVLFFLWIIGLLRALNGSVEELPAIGQFAEKFTF